MLSLTICNYYAIISNMKNNAKSVSKKLNNLQYGEDLKRRLKQVITNPISELEFGNVFQLLVAVVLSAQCTDKRVNIITKDLFEECKSPSDFLHFSQEELEDKIKSCNYYHNKASNILKMCKDLVDKFDGQVPDNYEDLISLSGVGNKTANVVLTVGFGKNAFPVDTHVLRVSNRLGLCNTNNPTKCENEIKEYFDENDYGLMHHLILLYGRYYCTSRAPKCDNCILKDLCKMPK